jgi:hypothetical protein
MPAWLADDDLLLRALGDAMRDEPLVTPEILAAAKSVYTWRTVDSEMAQLSYDSRDDNEKESLALVRADHAALRMLTFEARGLVVELGVSADAVVGQLVPPGADHIEFQQGDEEATRLAVDHLGCFALVPIPRGAFTLICQTSTTRITVAVPPLS